MLRDIYESYSFTLNVQDPLRYEEAHKNSMWRQVMEEEVHAINKNDTWVLIQAPADKNIIGPKWIYKTKYK